MIQIDMRISLTMAVVLLACYAGCGLNVIPLREDPEVLAMKNEGSQFMSSITLAPLTTLYDRDTSNPDSDKMSHSYIPEFDSEKEYLDYLDLFREFGLFPDMVEFKSMSGAAMEDVMRFAYENYIDYILKLEVDRYRVSFVRFSGSHVPNMFFWFFFAVPSWYVHDEIFKSEINIRASLIDVYTGRPVYEQVFESVFERALNDFQRGWKIFGVFRAPGFYAPQNYERVDSVLTPFVMKDLKVQVIESVKFGEFQKTVVSEPFKSHLNRNIGLCVGVSEYSDSRIPSVRFADKDAELTHNLLTDSEKGAGMNPLFCGSLLSRQATKKNILDQLEELGVKRTRKDDTFIFYFAGYGYTGKRGGEGYLIPSDCDMDRIPETAISISELKELIDRIQAAHIILIMDTSFYGMKTGRSLSGNSKGADYAFLEPLSEHDKIKLVLSCSPGEQANEFASLSNGLFTELFCDGVLTGKADADSDGAITLHEAYLYARNNVSDISGYKGVKQNSVMFGKNQSTVFLHRNRSD